MASIKERITASTNSVTNGKDLIAKAITTNLGTSASKTETFSSLSSKINSSSIGFLNTKMDSGILKVTSTQLLTSTEDEFSNRTYVSYSSNNDISNINSIDTDNDIQYFYRRNLNSSNYTITVYKMNIDLGTKTELHTTASAPNVINEQSWAGNNLQGAFIANKLLIASRGRNRSNGSVNIHLWTYDVLTNTSEYKVISTSPSYGNAENSDSNNYGILKISNSTNSVFLYLINAAKYIYLDKYTISSKTIQTNVGGSSLYRGEYTGKLIANDTTIYTLRRMHSNPHYVNSFRLCSNNILSGTSTTVSGENVTYPDYFCPTRADSAEYFLGELLDGVLITGGVMDPIFDLDYGFNRATTSSDNHYNFAYASALRDVYGIVAYDINKNSYGSIAITNIDKKVILNQWSNSEACFYVNTKKRKLIVYLIENRKATYKNINHIVTGVDSPNLIFQKPRVTISNVTTAKYYKYIVNYSIN